MGYTFHFRDVFAAQDALLSGLALTLQLTATTIVFGFLIGLGVAVASVYGPRWAQATAQGYVEAIRNTPLIVQLFLVFFGLPERRPQARRRYRSRRSRSRSISAPTPSRSCAPGSRASRARRSRPAVASASRASQIFRHVIFFPALRIVYPALASQFMLLMLATSVVSQIAAPDLFHAGSIIQSRTFRDFEVYTVVAVVYLALALCSACCSRSLSS